MGLYAQQTARVTEPVSEESALTLLESWTDQRGIDPLCLLSFSLFPSFFQEWNHHNLTMAANMRLFVRLARCITTRNHLPDDCPSIRPSLCWERAVSKPRLGDCHRQLYWPSFCGTQRSVKMAPKLGEDSSLGAPLCTSDARRSS